MSKNIDLVFRTDRFNLTVEGKDFINPCCYGEDLATLVRDRLTTRGYTAEVVYQEDWGWAFEVEKGGVSTWLGFGGTSDEDPDAPNLGEWRIFTKPKHGLFAKLGLGKQPDDPVLADLKLILAEEGMSDVKEDG